MAAPQAPLKSTELEAPPTQSESANAAWVVFTAL